MRHREPRPPSALIPAPLDSISVFHKRPDLAAAVREYVNAAQAPATQRARCSDWRVWAAWCTEYGVSPLPASPETAAAFLADQAKGSLKRSPRALATVRRYAATVGTFHELRGFLSPFKHKIVEDALEGITRTKGVRQNQKTEFTGSLAVDAVTAADYTPSAVRDRAVLLLGYAAAMRRSEICGLDVSDLRFVDDGILITIRRSKTDQRGEGREVAVPRLPDRPSCPVAAVREWLGLLGNASAGPLFRGLKRNGEPRSSRLNSGEVGKIVKRAAISIGLDPSVFGGHSLRSGYVTDARVEAGQEWTTIMEQTGHRTLSSVKRYARKTLDPFKASRVIDVLSVTLTKRKG